MTNISPYNRNPVYFYLVPISTVLSAPASSQLITLSALGNPPCLWDRSLDTTHFPSRHITLTITAGLQGKCPLLLFSITKDPFVTSHRRAFFTVLTSHKRKRQLNKYSGIHFL